MPQAHAALHQNPSCTQPVARDVRGVLLPCTRCKGAALPAPLPPAPSAASTPSPASREVFVDRGTWHASRSCLRGRPARRTRLDAAFSAAPCLRCAYREALPALATSDEEKVFVWVRTPALPALPSLAALTGRRALSAALLSLASLSTLRVDEHAGDEAGQDVAGYVPRSLALALSASFRVETPPEGVEVSDAAYEVFLSLYSDAEGDALARAGEREKLADLWGMASLLA